MFAQEYKQPIPHLSYPGCGDSTYRCSNTGYPQRFHPKKSISPVILYPALVQGEGAAASIVKGIRDAG